MQHRGSTDPRSFHGAYAGALASTRFALLVMASALLFALIPAASASATGLPATITENTTLTAAGNPYTGSPTIAAGVTLQINPGVRLNLSALTVNGTLKAEGSAEEPITFTGPKEVESGEWTSIRFEPGSGTSVLDHVAVIDGGGKEGSGIGGAIEVTKSSPTIRNSTFFRSRGSGIQSPAAPRKSPTTTSAAASPKATSAPGFGTAPAAG